MAGTTNTLFVAKKAAALTNPVALATFLQSDDATKAAAVYFPLSNPPNALGQTFQSQTLPAARFFVKAWGRCTTGTSGNMDLTLYYGTSITAASNTALGALGVQTNAQYAHWFLDATLIWDGRSQVLDGLYSGASGSTLALKANTLTTPKTAVDLTVAGNGLTIGAIFGTSNAANVFTMDGFSLEEI